VEGWRNCINEEIHNLYTSPSVTRVIKLRVRWMGHVACMGEMGNAFKILIRKPERKRTL
jgi:hypothetical protein